MVAKSKNKASAKKKAVSKKTAKGKATSKRGVAKRTAKKKPRVKSPKGRRLVVGGTFVDLEWGSLGATTARRILKNGISELDAWALMDSSEVGLTNDFFVSLNDKVLDIEVDRLSGELVQTRIGKPKRWTILKIESGDGEVYSAEITGSFESKSLSVSFETLSNGSLSYTIVTPSYDDVDFDTGDISTSSQSWCLIDPDGQEHQFELLDE